MRPYNKAVFAVLLAVATCALGAQEKLVSSTPAQPASWAVSLPVSVTDGNNRPFAGLGQDNVTIYENNRPQKTVSLNRADEPVSIGIILDLSGSMASRLNPARQAILRFIQTSNPRDEFFVIGFNDRPELIQDFTQSAETIQTRLAMVGARGRSALFDAIQFGLEKMKEAHLDRKVLLVVSDGANNDSNITEGKLRAQVRMADVQIDSLGIFDPYAATPEERIGPQLLSEWSEETGGQLFHAEELARIGDIAEEISTELRNQYVARYQPEDPTRDGKWRSVKVRINPSPGLPHLKVHVRTGYYAPLQ